MAEYGSLILIWKQVGKRMKRALTLSLLLMLGFPALATAQSNPDKPSIATTQTVKLSAQVVAVDHENHRVTLKGPQGGVRTIDVGEGARRLDEVEVGDTVQAEYVQHLQVEVMAVEGAKPGKGTMTAVARAPESEQPGMMASETTISMATVQAIDLEQGTFKLKWAEDDIREYVARDRENLKRADVGDLVVVTYTEAVAMQLQEIPKGEQ
jgi:hypothetical protein